MATERLSTEQIGGGFIAKFNKSRLVRASILLTFSNIVSGGLGYVYQLVMGRLLSTSEFALFSAFMALIMFASSPLSAMFMVISRRVAELKFQGRVSLLRKFYVSTQTAVLMVGTVFMLGLATLVDAVMALIRSPSHSDVLVFGGILVFSAFYIVNNAFFQGQQRFRWLAGTTILSVSLKIVLSVVFVMLGYGVGGALAGLALSLAVVWIWGLVSTMYSLPRAVETTVATKGGICFKSIFPMLVANIAFSAMTQLDMVLVNWLFPSGEASIYAAASVLGKAILYLPGGLVLALFPLVAESHSKQKSSAHLLKQAVLLTTLLCGLAAFTYWLLGEWIIDLLFGKKYPGAGELLRWYGFAILPMALVMVAEHFLLAKGRALFAWLFLLMSPIQVVAIQYWHSELRNVVAVMGICGVILVIVGYGMLWREYQLKYSG